MNKYVKYIGLATCALIVSPSVMAYTSCVGGTELTAPTRETNAACFDSASGIDRCNGMTFCKSNRKMKWWSAILWCQANGGKLATVEHVCPNTEINTACQNRVDTSLWINKLDGTANAYTVQWDGYLRSFQRHTELYALCE